MVDTITKYIVPLLFVDFYAYLNMLQCITKFIVDSSNVITTGALSMKKIKLKPLLVSKMNKGDRYDSGIDKVFRSLK